MFTKHSAVQRHWYSSRLHRISDSCTPRPYLWSVACWQCYYYQSHHHPRQAEFNPPCWHFLASLINVVTEISSSDSNNAIVDLTQWHHGQGFPKYNRYLLIGLFIVVVAVVVVVDVVVVAVASKTPLVGICVQHPPWFGVLWCDTVLDIRTLQNCAMVATKSGVQTIL